MGNIKIKIRLLSESIFGNGQSESSGVDIDILRDDYGLPYFKGKTFKGKLREEMERLCLYFSEFSDKDFTDIIEKLLGKSDSFNSKTLKFSNCVVADEIHKNIEYGIEQKIFSADEVFNALTDVRTFTKINGNGIAAKGSLRQARVIRSGLILYCDIFCMSELDDFEKGILAASSAALRNLGTMESRGKGNVECSMIENEQDVTLKYIEKLKQEV